MDDDRSNAMQPPDDRSNDMQPPDSSAIEDLLSPDSRPRMFSVPSAVVQAIQKETAVPNNTPVMPAHFPVAAVPDEEDEESDDEEFEDSDLAGHLAEAIQSHMAALVGRSSGYIESLPYEVRRRVGALVKLDTSIEEATHEYERDKARLILKYEKMYAKLLTKRKDIVVGKYEPTDDECLPKTGPVDEDETTTTGVPGFWSTVFTESEPILPGVEEHDEDVLHALMDVTTSFVPAEGENGQGFIVTFTFAPNDVFEDKTLSVKFMYNPSDASMLHHAEGSEIHWKEGKNLTVQCVSRTQRHAKSGKQRVVSKRVPRDSFFRIFSPPTLEAMSAAQDAGKDDELEKMENSLHMAYEVCHTLRHKIVPNATKIFAGCYDGLQDDDEEDEL